MLTSVSDCLELEESITLWTRHERRARHSAPLVTDCKSSTVPRTSTVFAEQSPKIPTTKIISEVIAQKKTTEYETTAVD